MNEKTLSDLFQLIDNNNKEILERLVGLECAVTNLQNQVEHTKTAITWIEENIIALQTSNEEILFTLSETENTIAQIQSNTFSETENILDIADLN